MALITVIFLFLVGTVATALSRLVTDEFTVWIPWIIRAVIRRAIVWLPPAQRNRFEEEWQSHINEVPGEIGKLIAALGFLIAARKMTLVEKEHAPVTFLLAPSSQIGDANKGLGEQMNLVATQLLNYSYLFPPKGPITSSEKDEVLKYYSDNIRPELEFILSKFKEQKGQLLEEDVCVYCEYHNFETNVENTDIPGLMRLFGRHQFSEIARQLAVLALRVTCGGFPFAKDSGH